MNYDFSSLSQPVTKHDIDTYATFRAAQYGDSPGFFTTTVKLVSIFVFFIVAIFLLTAFGNANPVSPFIALLFLGMPIILIISVSSQRKKENARLFRFAQANKAHAIIDQSDPDYAGTIFVPGSDRTINGAVVFPDGKEIGNYRYTIRSGRNSTQHVWGYMRIKLKRRLPHMLLDSKKNNFFGNMLSNLPTSLSKDQIIRLEGDFNEHFTLYAPEGYEQDAFYVFTPDVMAALVDHGTNYDIEVVDDYLLFYSSMPFNFSSGENIQEALSILENISTELIDQTDYYADAHVGNRAANVIAEPGKRLKSKVGIAVIVIAVIFVLFQLNGFLLQIFFMLRQ